MALRRNYRSPKLTTFSPPYRHVKEFTKSSIKGGKGPGIMREPVPYVTDSQVTSPSGPKSINIDCDAMDLVRRH